MAPFQFMTPEQRIHPKIHETHEIPAFPVSERNEIWTTPIPFMCYHNRERLKCNGILIISKAKVLYNVILY